MGLFSEFKTFAMRGNVMDLAVGVVIGGAFGLIINSLVGDVIKGRSGKVIAIFQMAGDAGMMVGPILLGYISDISSYRTAFATTAIAFSIAILLAARLPETRNLVATQDRN